MHDAEWRGESRLIINGESMVKSGDVDPDAEIDRLSIASRLSKPGLPTPHSSSRYAVEPGDPAPFPSSRYAVEPGSSPLPVLPVCILSEHHCLSVRNNI